MQRYRMVSATDWCGCSLVADDDVAVLGPLGDHRELAARRRRLSVGEAHQRQVDALSRLRHYHPRAGHGRADPERPRRVASDDTRLATGDRVDTRIGCSEVSSATHRTPAVAVATAWDVGRYQHCIHTCISVSRSSYYLIWYGLHCPIEYLCFLSRIYDNLCIYGEYKNILLYSCFGFWWYTVNSFCWSDHFVTW